MTPNPDLPIHVMIWMRPDGKLFAHLMQDNKPVSDRFGPFNNDVEVKSFFSGSAIITPDMEAERALKDCGPLMIETQVNPYIVHKN